MANLSTWRNYLASAGLALAALGTTGSAVARDVVWSVGVGAPGAQVIVGNAPVYVAPPVVVHAPAPRYYRSPAPVYYAPPVYHAAPPVYYQPRTIYYAPAPRFHGHRHGHRYDRHDRHDRHDRGHGGHRGHDWRR